MTSRIEMAAPPRIAVDLREDQAGELHSLVEALRDIDGLLVGHRAPRRADSSA